MKRQLPHSRLPLACCIATILAVLPVLQGATAAIPAIPGGAHTDASGRIQVDVHYDCSLAPPLAALQGAGLAPGTQVKAPPYCVVEGWVQPAAWSTLAAIPGVLRVSLPIYARPRPPGEPARAKQALRQPSRRDTATASGINVNGVKITRADQFISQTGVQGAGVTVGVQSSGADSWQAMAGLGALPANVQILYPAGSSTMAPGDDEGTMLMEQIHAIAPGAGLAYCGPVTFADYASCLQQLIGAGATVLVDDMGLVADDLLDADNDQTSAVSNILAANPKVALYTSAGNANGSYWEGTYQPVAPATQGAPALACNANGTTVTDSYVADFGTGQAATLSVAGSYDSFPLLLAWNDTAGQPATRFDIYVYSGSTLVVCLDSGDATINPDGHQLSQQFTLAGGNYTLYVASTTAPVGTFIKLWAGGDGLTAITPSTPGGTLSPQAAASGAMSIGAVDGNDGIGATLETFSSTGPITFARPALTRVQAPALVAPDDINVQATGTEFAMDGLLWPDPTGQFSQGLFKGTSAAVPNAGGVAALIRAAWPQLDREQLNQVLESGATWLGGSGSAAPDGSEGFGRVDALGAAAAAQAATGSAPTPPPAASSAPATGNSSSTSSSGTTSSTTSATSTSGHSGGGGALGFGELGVLALALGLGWHRGERRTADRRRDRPLIHRQVRIK